MKCEYCGDSLRSPRKKVVEHVNISQPQQTHHFCSQDCRDKWRLQLQKNESRLIVMWCIGSYIGRYFFLKKIMKVHSSSLIGSESNKSFFKSNFHEIEALKLVELNGRKILKVEN